jgi:hypothetical protein
MPIRSIQGLAHRRACFPSYLSLPLLYRCYRKKCRKGV